MSVQLLTARQRVDRTMHIRVPHVTIGENRLQPSLVALDMLRNKH